MASKQRIGIGLGMIENMYPGKYNPDTSKKIAGIWYDIFLSVSDETFLSALRRCFSVCVFPPCAADVSKAVKEEMLQIISFQDMWNDFINVLHEIDRYAEKFSYNDIEDNGLTSGTNAKLSCKQYYLELPEYIKGYFGSFSEAVNMIEILYDSGKRANEKKNFIAYIKHKIENAKFEELREIVGHYPALTKANLFVWNQSSGTNMIDTTDTILIEGDISNAY